LNNNQVIDVFWVTNFFNKGVLDLNEQKRTAKHVMSALNQKDFKPLQSFTKDQQKLAVNPQITIDNEMSKQVTTFQILSGDRPGLLMDILGVFHDKQISVQSAKISTYGEKVFDIFQLTNSNNQKIKDTKLLKSIENNLISIL
jgi:[protein-PII] uridylyltransferase